MPHRRWALGVLSVGPALALGAWQVRASLPFMADDAFISLRYAQRLLAGDGLTWTDGERVEGYSNLLWVLACAAVGRFTDLVSAARVVGVTSSVVMLLALSFWLARSWGGALAAAAATCLLALAGPLTVWTIGGLEQPLLAALLCLGALGAVEATAAREGVPALAKVGGVALGLACWTRPDAPLLIAALAAGLVVSRGLRGGVKPAAWLLVPAVVATVAQQAFRRAYYGEWVPNTAHLKLALSLVRMETGWDYVASAWRVLLPFVAFAVLGLVGAWRVERTVRSVLGVCLALLGWVAYVVVIGGDIFPARRHLVPCLLLLAIVGAWGLRLLLERGGRARLLAGAAALLCVAGGAWWGVSDARSLDARSEQWEWQGEVSGRLLAAAFAPVRPLVAVHSAGCVPFFSGLPSIDMLGLNDAWIARHPPPGYGRSSVSYDLHAVGDPDYVMRRQPDLILPCGPLGSEVACGSIPSAAPLFAHPRFRAEYAPMRFRGELPFSATGTAWVRVSSPIALTPGAGRYTIRPALLARAPATLRLEQGATVVEVPGHARVVVDRLPPGTVEGAGLGTVQATMVGGTLVLENRGEAPVLLQQVVVTTAP